MNKLKKFFSVMFTITFFVIFIADVYAYEHDPMQDPDAAKDIIADVNAVYGYRPSPDSTRLKEFVNYLDWTDEEQVAKGREERREYLEGFSELYAIIIEMINNGETTENIARRVSTRRNEMRLESYAGDPEGLATVKKSNLEKYGHEEGPTPDEMYEKYGSWQTVIDKALSSNKGMDACLGFYDENYYHYHISEYIPVRVIFESLDNGMMLKTADGLDKLLSEDEKKQIVDGKISVDLALALQRTENSETEGMAIIDDVVSGVGLTVDMYLDLSLIKTTVQLENNSSSTETINNIDATLLEIVFPYGSDENIMLYRYSNGKNETFTKLSGAKSGTMYADGDFYIDDDGEIHIFTTELGTFAAATESTEHIHSYIVSEIRKATYSKNGEIIYICKECGDKYTEITDKLSKKETPVKSSGGGKSSTKALSKTETAEVEKDISDEGKTELPQSTDDNTNKAVETYKGFADVKGLWCEKTVNELHEKGIVNGRTATLFAPNENLTRAELVQLLANMKGIDISTYKNKTSKFADVNKNAWYYAAVAWAEENNIVYGVSADKFAPEKNISREDTAAIIYRYMGISADTNAKSFADSASISGYAKEAVGTLSSKGIINGYPDNSFKSKNTVTRAETASILYNITE